MKSLYRRRLDRILPPNVDRERVRVTAAVSLCIATLLSMMSFFTRYTLAREMLYTRTVDGRAELIPGATIQAYHSMIGNTVFFFAVLTAAALASAGLMYASFFQGGRSIYLMRRLPDGGRTLRRFVWAAPVRMALLCVLWCLALLAIYFFIWRFATPAQCLGPAFVRMIPQ
ncbi:MAG: hypothetical protein II458_07055 [Oscillospiraceae bacterium]|nr:hypothetical protein [Oscillospiraceae bacterium]